MKSSGQLLLLGMLWPLSAATAADNAAATGPAVAPDTSQWKCESCPFDKGQSGAVEVGAGYVSDKSAKFGEYNGLHRRGVFGIVDGEARSRGPDGAYWNVNASNLGLRTRSVDVEGGQQGRYKLGLNYDEIPHFISDTAQTPYLGTGGASLTLPAGFPATSTAAMPLAGTLHQVDLDTRRKRFGVGGSWLAASDWEYSVSFRRETKDGMKRTAGAFFINSAQLIEPVDYTTDQINASVSYSGVKWQAKLAYYGSLFRNSNNALTWQNPFTFLPTFPGAGTGQLALPPDNQFHQILASAGYQFSDRTRGTAEIAYGRMTQDEGFLPATINPTIVAALPRTSLDGRANTLNANVRLTSAVTDGVRLNAVYTRDERNNHSPQALYPVVSTDLFLGTPRTNLPYSFTQDKLKLSADFKATATTKAMVGFDHENKERTFQEASTTREETIWGKIASRALENVDVSLKLAYADRTNSGYTQVTSITPPENPLMRKYYMADRKRESAALRADIAASETVNIGFGVATSRDDYSNSPIGLTSGNELSVNGDVSVRLTEQTIVHFFANRERITSKQANSQSFSVPDWNGDNNDTIDFFGLGIKHAAIKDKLDLGADYGVMRARSDVNVITGAGNPSFPAISSSLDSLKLYATYRVKDNVSLNAGYWHERYDTKNWMLDGVTPSTIPNVLTLGEQPPRYTVNVFRVSVRYKF